MTAPATFEGVLKLFIDREPADVSGAAASAIRSWGYEEDEGLYWLDLSELDTDQRGSAHIGAAAYGRMDDAVVYVEELSEDLADALVELLRVSGLTLLAPTHPFAPIVASLSAAAELPPEWPPAIVCRHGKHLVDALRAVDPSVALRGYSDFVRWLPGPPG